MCMYSVVDGIVQEWYYGYLMLFVFGGVGLIVVEVMVVVFEGCIFLCDVGLWNDEQCDVWVLIVVVIYGCGGFVGIQFVYVGWKVLIWWFWVLECGLVFVVFGGWIIMVFFVVVFDGFVELFVFDFVGIERIVVVFVVVVR